MRGGEECFWASESAQAKLSPVFQPVEHALHDVARFVEFGVVVELHLVVLAGRNAGGCFRLIQRIAQVVGIVYAVCNDRASLPDIRLKALVYLGNVYPISPDYRRAKLARF